ncbi:MAG: NepR family anti-sigma factor [Paracoccaceae bacterium]|nr:NepR family anti-sigma factor [Paracoccaceae bacterium]
MPKESNHEKDKKNSGPAMSPDPISDSLKRVFDETLNEPLPQELADLLDRLKSGSP